jgi:hypothetical protein
LRQASADRLSFRVPSKSIDARRAPSLAEPHQAPLWGFKKKENIMSNTQPTLIAYSLKERDKGKDDIWTKIGAAFPHGKGTGMTILLDALPLGNRIVLCEPKEDKPEQEA